MANKLFRLVMMAAGAFCLALAVSSLAAQESSALNCAAVLQTNLAALSAACADTPSSAVCFGPASGSLDEVASSIGDKLLLSDISGVVTIPDDNNPIGLALLHVHANVPLARSDLGLKYLLIGDVRLENAVDPGSAFVPVEPLTITPLVPANLRASTSTEARIIGSAPVGVELLADGVSSDRAWVRVVKDDQQAWVSRQIVTASSGDIETLPVVTASSETLMQRFSLQTDTSEAKCTAVTPSMLFVQAPTGIEASITANGAGIRFADALVLRTDGSALLVTALGSAAIGRTVIPAGFTVSVSFDADGTAGSPSQLRPISAEDRAALQLLAAQLPENLVHAPLSIPSEADVAAVLGRAGGGQTTSGPASDQADCSRFAANSPSGTAPSGIVTFFWDAARGATSYRLRIYGADSSLISSIDASAGNTALAVDLGSVIPGGGAFSWNVEALVDGQIACSSNRIFLFAAVQDQFVGQGGGEGGGGAPLPTPTVCTWPNC